MKQNCKVFFALVVLVILTTSLGITSTVESTVVTAQEKAETFTEKALPIDKSQYKITLDGYYVSNPPNIKVGEPEAYTRENVRYSLVADESELTVSYIIENNVLTTCAVSAQKGSIITDQPYDSLNAAVMGFLEKYQTYKGEDMSDLRYMISSVDATKNQTVILGDLKLEITNGDYSYSGHKTSLMWYQVINDCAYLELSLGFTNGTFTGFRDIRELSPIGDTSVNISKEQAIAIAMKYIQNYTYEMPGNVWITDFKVIEDRTTAMLLPTARNSTLYPAWHLMLTLDHTYPGSVYALYVIVWADFGEVLSCNNQAGGGTLVPNTDSNNVVILPSPSTSSPSPSLLEPPVANAASSDNNMITVIAAVLSIAIIVVLIMAIAKKRSK